ncbi:YaaL family protein [Clostridium oryzae]|uniref:DUF2508 domain-containing protein n=1 Tax=Clostridium oryzae TaxID=1450648 RepID=A0A1V4IX78_9CLOT|nr:YaaL family protein [Clostridium oryzae]OPJ64662.1 hypothetical protein CLORY_05320 [Clostridium oryzae]
MNKIEMLKRIKKSERSKTEKELIEAINDAVYQLENARYFFENVNDPKLIDYAIYMEEAAKARYGYLLSEAKRLNIKLNTAQVIKEAEVI